MKPRLLVLCCGGWILACGTGTPADPSADGTTQSSASPSSAGSANDDGDGDGGGTGDATAGEDDPGADTTEGGGATEPTADSDTGVEPGSVELPPPDGALDYQLGGAYAPPRGVVIVSRDRTEPPEPGLYNICYVNGFQAQPHEDRWWLAEHPDLVLRDDNGDPVIDPDWDEMLLDTSTAEKRSALAEIMGEWIAACGTDGYDAIEIDNLDSYARSDGLLTQDHAVAYMALLSAAAHAEGMAIAQKNSTELVARRDEMDTDFVVAEECNRYDECADYTDAYGDAVLVIEYRAEDFEAGCASFPELSIVLRDLNLVTPGDGAYVYDGC